MAADAEEDPEFYEDNRDFEMVVEMRLELREAVCGKPATEEAREKLRREIEAEYYRERVEQYLKEWKPQA